MTPEGLSTRVSLPLGRSVEARPRARERRWALGVLLVCLASTLSPAHASAQADARRDRVYLTQLALLVEGARRLIAFGESNLDEKELIKFACPLAERYVEMAGHMLPPPKIMVVHPHLLLVVENLDRALDSAAAGDMPGYQKRSRIARDELANLEAVLKQLKVRLPEPAR